MRVEGGRLQNRRRWQGGRLVATPARLLKDSDRCELRKLSHDIRAVLPYMFAGAELKDCERRWAAAERRWKRHEPTVIDRPVVRCDHCGLPNPKTTNCYHCQTALPVASENQFPVPAGYRNGLALAVSPWAEAEKAKSKCESHDETMVRRGAVGGGVCNECEHYIFERELSSSQSKGV